MEDRKESIKKALLTIKKECSRYDECEDGQCIVVIGAWIVSRLCNTMVSR